MYRETNTNATCPPVTTRMMELGPISVENSRMTWYTRNTIDTRGFNLATATAKFTLL